jgi:hypothetical protein
MRLAISNDDGRIGIPPNPSIIEGSWQKTPSEMEEQIKNLNQWAGEVAQYLPLLATKEDLKAFATKEDLQATKGIESGPGGRETVHRKSYSRGASRDSADR